MWFSKEYASTAAKSMSHMCGHKGGPNGFRARIAMASRSLEVARSALNFGPRAAGSAPTPLTLAEAGQDETLTLLRVHDAKLHSRAPR